MHPKNSPKGQPCKNYVIQVIFNCSMEFIDAEADASQSIESSDIGSSTESSMSDMHDDGPLSDELVSDATSESEAESTSVSDNELLRQYVKIGQKIRSRQLVEPEVRAKRARLVSSSSDEA